MKRRQKRSFRRFQASQARVREANASSGATSPPSVMAPGDCGVPSATTMSADQGIASYADASSLEPPCVEPVAAPSTQVVWAPHMWRPGAPYNSTGFIIAQTESANAAACDKEYASVGFERNEVDMTGEQAVCATRSKVDTEVDMDMDDDDVECDMFATAAQPGLLELLVGESQR